MKHLYIIRHGETDFNKTQKMQGRGIDASLNELGRYQAQAVADSLQKVAITKIVTSSLKRTLETAQPLITQSGASVESHRDLDEMSFGSLEGKEFHLVKDEIKYLHTNWTQGNLDVKPDNGESPKEVYNRAHSRVMEILLNSDDEHIAFVIHGRLIRILLSEWLGFGLSNMDRIDHSNGAINKLFWTGNEFNPITLNILDHLDIKM